MAHFIKSFILTVFSLLIIILFKFKKVNIGHFTSVKFAYKKNLDPRTHLYLNDKKAIFIIRTQNFFYSILALLKYRNTIFFNFIFNFNYSLGRIFLFEENKIFNFNITMMSKIFKFLKIREFHMIDDYRNIQLFSEVCKYNNTKLFIYQHGRFTTTLPDQTKIKDIKFEKYFVWSNFFKKKLLKFNKTFDRKNVEIKKRFIKKISFINKKNSKNQKIIIIHEKNVQTSEYQNIIKKIIKTKKNYKIYFKFRNNEKIEIKLEKILKELNIKIFHSENVYEIMENIQFDCLIGFNSTLLLEASYFNICPIMVYKSEPHLKDYLNDKVFFTSKIKDLDKKIIILLKKKKEIKRFKKKIWDKC
jgi:hypothetical protein